MQGQTKTAEGEGRRCKIPPPREGEDSAVAYDEKHKVQRSAMGAQGGTASATWTGRRARGRLSY